MNITYSKIDKFNLTNKVRNIIHPNYGRCFDFNQTNKYLFGVNGNIENISYFDLKNRKIIFSFGGSEENNIKGQYYIRFDKFNEYFDYIESVTDFTKELKDEKIFLPFNYFLVNNKKIPYYYNEIFMIFQNFKKYLKKVNTVDSRSILNYMGGDIFFAGYLSTFVTNPFMLSISFDTEYKPFTIGISKNTSQYFKYSGYIDMTSEETINFSIPYIYEDLCKKILYNDEKKFVIINLTRVVGNQSFAEMLFKSYSDKETFSIPVEEVEEIIQFKDNNAKNQYLEIFLSKYKNNIYIKLNSNYHLNFEGFNKYLLNLDEKYLLNFRVKESINNIYFNITNELINCYRQLYHNK